MSDFTEQDILEAIDELTPRFMHNILQTALTDVDFDFDRQGLILTGEINASTSVIRTSVIRREDSLWLGIQDEIFDFFCTTSSKYTADRTQAEKGVKSLILLIAGAIATKFHLATAVISGMITLAVIGVFKISKNAWCKIQHSKRDTSLQSGS
ncbi:hypothetical protein [Pseudomonas viridiflava]|uniref:hypothetical protein n=1 Tax=Pseudomonas viridiflava TaxID=33069 RepID=UPI000F037CB7|nr:hypothetical protein [Pseudomonas viridiflava]